VTQADFSIFAEWFNDLADMFRLYARDEQKAAMLGSYFQTLEKYPLERVRLGYERLKEISSRWPHCAAWIAAMPRQDGGELSFMDWRQVKASDEAERLFYEGDLCHCRECVEASVTHLPLRYVPCLNADGELIALRHPNRSHPVYLGGWIHGYWLRNWYAARSEFYQKLEATKPKAMPKPELQLVKTLNGRDA